MQEHLCRGSLPRRDFPPVADFSQLPGPFARSQQMEDDGDGERKGLEVPARHQQAV